MVKPDKIVKTIFDIDYDSLIASGKKFFIFDFDNTINVWKSKKIPEKVIELFEELKKKGCNVLIASNGKKRKLNYDIDVIWRTLKPFTFRALKRLKGTSKDKIVVIGDQIFTDILFGKLLGAYTIKVEPLSIHHEHPWTKLMRKIERLLFKKHK